MTAGVSDNNFANDIGWPPAEPLGKDRWGGILGGRPLTWWADVTWKPEQTDCSFAKLSSASRGRVQSIVSAVNDKTADDVTARRHNHALKYLKGFTRRQASSDGTRPLRQARFSAARKKFRIRFAVAAGEQPQGRMPFTLPRRRWVQ